MANTSVQIDNKYASNLKNLHVPGNPIVFANVYDIPSTQALLSLRDPSNSNNGIVKAVATASYAIAQCAGVLDEDLTLEQNFAAVRAISPLVRAAGIPLSIDLQDGGGDQIVAAVEQAVRLGAVGINLEDTFQNIGYSSGFDGVRSIESQVERIKIVLETVKSLGVKDFVVNARTDILKLDPVPESWSRQKLLEETIRRGKAYLDAGATCVFVWGGDKNGVSTEEVKSLVDAFHGMLAVKLGSKATSLSVEELAKIGVCRVSVGPSLQLEAMAALQRAAERILGGGKLYDSRLG